MRPSGPAPPRPPAADLGDLWQLGGDHAWPAWRARVTESRDRYLAWAALDVPTFRQAPAALHNRIARVTQRLSEAVYTAPSEAEAEDAFLLLLSHHRLLLSAVLAHMPPTRRLRARAQRRAKGSDLAYAHTLIRGPTPRASEDTPASAALPYLTVYHVLRYADLMLRGVPRHAGIHTLDSQQLESDGSKHVGDYIVQCGQNDTRNVANRCSNVKASLVTDVNISEHRQQ